MSDIELESEALSRYPPETLMVMALKELNKNIKSFEERLTKLESKVFR